MHRLLKASVNRKNARSVHQKCCYPNSGTVLLQRFRSGCRDTAYLAALGSCSQSWLDWCRRRWAGPQERLVPPFILYSDTTHAQLHTLTLLVCVLAVQSVLDRCGGSSDRGRERRRVLGGCNACWDDCHEKVRGSVFKMSFVFKTVSTAKCNDVNFFFRYGGADTGDRTMVTVFTCFSNLIDVFVLNDLFNDTTILGAVFAFLSSWMPCVLPWTSWQGCLQRHQLDTWLYSRRRLRYILSSCYKCCWFPDTRSVSFSSDNVCFLPLEGSHRGGVNPKSCSKGRTSQLHCSRAGHATRPWRRGHSSHL